MADIRHAIAIQAPPQRVLELASTADGLRRWWAADVSSNDAASVELGFFDRTTIYALQLVSKTPARVEWLCASGEEWKGTRLIFELSPAKDGTQLRFTHAGWEQETEYFVSCTTTWGGLMFRLKAEAEGHGQGALFTAAGMAY